MTHSGLLGRHFRLVVIGASAGAIGALSAILPLLPPTVSLPVVIVVHVPTARPSLLSKIFAAQSQVAVREAEDKEPLERGTVYFAPPDYHVIVEPELRLSLDSDVPVNFSRPSIDVLFQSAADACGPELVGVVLSGAGNDGTAGLSAIREAGGLTVVQDPSTAEATLMPESAIARVKPHHVLAPAGIGELLRLISDKVS